MAEAPHRSRRLFQKLERNLLELGSKPGADSVHRFRTSTRRLQTLLEHLAPDSGFNREKLLKLLGRIRKRAGKVRDLDVQLAALRSLRFPQEPRRKTQLVDHLIELRGEKEKRMRKALDKKTLREIRKRLKKVGKDFKPQDGRDPLAVARHTLEQIVRPDAPLTEEAMHQYRILTKRARYAAEFAVKTPASSQLLAALKRIQDALGDWHDWFTLTRSAREFLGDVRESSLVAELHNVTGAKFRHAVSVLTQVRATLEPAKPAVPRRAPVKREAKRQASAA